MEMVINFVICIYAGNVLELRSARSQRKANAHKVAGKGQPVGPCYIKESWSHDRFQLPTCCFASAVWSACQ
eukprot:scaffold574119_cov19-Prasinocladus_malaysianus.AAC.1